MYTVYWTEVVPDPVITELRMDFSVANETPTSEPKAGQANSVVFDTKEMNLAINFMAKLRDRRAAGELISFVGMVSEHPDSVGLPGVSDKLPEGYDWKKRRI